MIVAGLWDEFAKVSCVSGIGPLEPMGQRCGVLPGAMSGMTGVLRTWRGVPTLHSSLNRHPNLSTALIYIAEDLDIVIPSSVSQPQRPLKGVRNYGMDHGMPVIMGAVL